VAGDTTITLVGNLVADPELRFTPSGQAVANFRVASTPRVLDKASNEWKDGEGLFLTVTVWRTLAENCAESLVKGSRVIVQGRLKQRTYETREGEKRTVYEIDAEDVGPSLLRATAKVARTSREGAGAGAGGGSSYGGGGGGSGSGSGSAGGSSGGGSAGASDPWSTGGSGGGFSDEPPF
jgi:single-strand DNA-binding protein